MTNSKNTMKPKKTKQKPKDVTLKSKDKEIIQKLSQSTISLKTKSVKEIANNFENKPDKSNHSQATIETNEDTPSMEEGEESSGEEDSSSENEEEDVFNKPNFELTENSKATPDTNDEPISLQNMNSKLEKINSIENKINNNDEMNTKLEKINSIQINSTI